MYDKYQCQGIDLFLRLLLFAAVVFTDCRLLSRDLISTHVK